MYLLNSLERELKLFSQVFSLKCGALQYNFNEHVCDEGERAGEGWDREKERKRKEDRKNEAEKNKNKKLV